ncbi:3-keto-disaccharide hydrolase [Aureliella helgolandensis]|uniref:3-keto-alpha-glucoside-1,2-lyase/3-keto-2-hydroxy-glucal hydratase domain-containing protein n=1 Tax=Aureliella helgolandensis TaxID=2527968 RepID=A0A518G942_9BACT|nr:DUF1080 domain-containing protein [Aureliella helgolandensis]QDV25118.1 hypothetical protein Q31a_34410 [Aureliella helgolandensis]
MHNVLFPAVLRANLLALVLTLFSTTVVLAEAPAGFVPLFNGTDLTGWKGLVGNPKTRAEMTASELSAAQAEADASMRAHWKAVDGVLVFDGAGKSLCTAKDYGDFELYVDWKIGTGGDSGIYLRGSPQVQIWDTEHVDYFRHGAENGSGALWNNQQHPRFPLIKADKPVGQWNTFYIRMLGERVTIKLNDQLVSENVVMENLWDRNLPIYPRGQIELQNHGNTLYFRDLYVREIPASEANALLAEQAPSSGFQPLFNGRDLTGWQGDLASCEVVEGSLVWKKGMGGTVFSENEYADFVAQLEFKLEPGGNNGLALRYAGEGSPNLEGFELQILDSEDPQYADIDPRQHHGSAYGLAAAHRGYLRPVGEWNFQQVTMRGSRLLVELNGFTILDTDLSEAKEFLGGGHVPAGAMRESGYFGFAGHNEPVAFRNIAIRELPGEPAEPPSGDAAISPVDGPVQIFNGRNLEGFYSWNRDSAYSDPKKVFAVEDGMLHISGDGYGGLITNQTYRDYHLVIEFKWGGKTWGDRVDRARDSGVLVHAWGPDGGFHNTWMAAIEAQIIEGGVGDILVLSGIDPVTGQALPTTLTAEIGQDRDGEKVWRKGAERTTLSSGRINWFGRDVDWADRIDFRGREDVESPMGEWTRMEVIAEGGHLVYRVNGVMVNEAFDAKPDSGKLVLQTEQAEMWVRRFELWPLGKANLEELKQAE